MEWNKLYEELNACVIGYKNAPPKLKKQEAIAILKRYIQYHHTREKK